MPQEDIRLTTLPNGLRVLSERVPGVHSAALGVWIAAGARYEDPLSEGGIAHLTEHMLFKGTLTRSPATIAGEVEAVGGNMNAYTGREITAYHIHALPEDLPLCADILADMVRRSTVPEDELLRERDVVLQEIGMNADTPDDYIWDMAYATAWPDQPLGAPILGTPQTVKAITRTQILDYIHRAYPPRRIVFGAFGAIKHDAIYDLVMQHFGDMEDTKSAAPSTPALYKGGEAKETRSLEQSHVVLAFPGLARQDEDYEAARALALILGGGMASRLFQEVREKRGLAYSVHASHSAYHDTGLFMLYAATHPKSTKELIPVLRDEALRLAETLTPQEVARAKAQLCAHLFMRREGMMRRADMAARHLLLQGEILDVAQARSQINAISSSSIVRVAERIFEKAQTLALLGPE